MHILFKQCAEQVAQKDMKKSFDFLLFFKVLILPLSDMHVTMTFSNNCFCPSREDDCDSIIEEEFARLLLSPLIAIIKVR